MAIKNKKYDKSLHSAFQLPTRLKLRIKNQLILITVHTYIHVHTYLHYSPLFINEEK